MINEEKLKTMIELASYEANQGKQDFEIMKRLKGNYISHHGFINCLFATIGLLILFVADFGIKFLEEMSTFTDFDYVGEGVQYLTIWIVFMVLYGFLSGRVYRKEYTDAEKRIRHYKEKMRSLSRTSRSI